MNLRIELASHDQNPFLHLGGASTWSVWLSFKSRISGWTHSHSWESNGKGLNIWLSKNIYAPIESATTRSSSWWIMQFCLFFDVCLLSFLFDRVEEILGGKIPNKLYYLFFFSRSPRHVLGHIRSAPFLLPRWEWFPYRPPGNVAYPAGHAAPEASAMVCKDLALVAKVGFPTSEDRTRNKKPNKHIPLHPRNSK